jgi:GNAT superfamily N-acetyltransferase
MRVRPANRSDHGPIAAALAAAFATDPPLSFLIPDERRREALLRRHFSASMRLYASGAIWVAEDRTAAALWVAPGRYPFRMREELAVAPARLEVFGRWARRGIGAQRAIDRHHPRDPPHWYLDYIGVEPAGQGRGLGSALLAPMLARCDTEGRGAYLNAGSPRSRDLYQRHGFVVRSEFRLPFGGPPMWRMWREPRRAQASTSSPVSAS